MKTFKVLGTGCAKCHNLADNTRAAADELGIEYDLDYVTDLNEIMQFGVMVTPALVVDGEVKVVGRVPSADAIRDMLG